MSDDPAIGWMLCRLDPAGVMTSVEGPIAEEVLSVPTDEAIGRPVADLARPGTVSAFMAGWTALINRPRGSRRDLLHVKDTAVTVTTVHRPVAGGLEVLFVVDDTDTTPNVLRPSAGRRSGRQRTGAEQVDHGLLVDALNAILAEDPTATLVAVIDLDGFAEVNRRFGLTGGNMVLDAVTERVRSILRTVDLISRSHGDEFVIVCRDVGDGGVPAVSRRVSEVLESPLVLPSGSWVPAASLGAVRPMTGEDATQVIDRARHAMAVAKRERRAERVMHPLFGS